MHTLRMPTPSTDLAAEPTRQRSAREWFEALYQELRRRARGELFRHQALTLGATTLLHETWLRMEGRPLEFASQPELVAYAGRVMRGIVIDHVRARRTVRHGGEFEFIPYDTLQDLHALDDDRILELDEALHKLAAADVRLAETVELHFFAGLDYAEIAALRGQSVRTVMRDWDKARTYLFAVLKMNG